MFKKYFGFVLLVLIISSFFSQTVSAATAEEKEAAFAEKVKANIVKSGTGEKAQIEVKLKNGTKVKGCVSRINEQSFIVIDQATGQETTIDYAQVTQARGNHWSARKGIFYGAIIGLAVIAVVIAVELHNDR